MKKVYLMKGMAALAMGLVAVSCNKVDFSGQPEVSKEEAIANAEMQLGLTIDPNQNWKMTKEVKANVGVKLGTGDNYTLLIYDKNPFAYNDAAYLAKQAVSDGAEVNLNVTMPSGQAMVYVVALDSKGHSTVRRALVTEGAVNVAFTAEANAPALRRANAGENYNATSTGINANANEWADPTPGKQFGGWVVPDPLTDEQKAVVKAYFQNVDKLTYQAPEWRHFFVQQVYKGGSDPGTLGNKEVNKGADNTTYSSDNMNLLSVGYNDQHINNFNSGSASTVGVLAKGFTANDFDAHHHTDQMMLMVNIDDTSCMSYHNSGSSQQRRDKAGLVGWETIRTWANANNLNGDCLDDGWNRSFVGFDFELYSLQDSYAKDNGGNQLYAPVNAVPGNAPQYVWTGTEVQKISAQSAPRRGAKAMVARGDGGTSLDVWTGNTQVSNDELNTYAGGSYIVVNGQQVPYLDANMNLYGGIQKSLADGDMKITKDGKECLNLPKFKELVDDGYLPVEDKNLRTWVKWQGGDGYYSDWIVTLTKANRIGDQEKIDTIVPPQRPTVWSYAFEDTALGDYDLNDVVLKASEDDDNITLTLVAAGATLDLNIRLYDYDENGANGYGSNYVTLTYNNCEEIHDMLNVDHGTMVNTGGNSANVNNLPTFTLSKANYDAANLRLAIYSESQGEVRLSGSGDTPHGVLIPYDWSWPTERTHITRAYNKTDSSEAEADQSFSNFASNAGHAEWWFKYPTGSVMK